MTRFKVGERVLITGGLEEVEAIILRVSDPAERPFALVGIELPHDEGTEPAYHTISLPFAYLRHLTGEGARP